MHRFLLLAFRGATLAVALLAIAALVPFLGHSAPAAGQFGQIGGFGQFGGTCSGFGIGGIGQFGGCSFGSGFAGGFGQSGGFGQFGGFALATPSTRVRVGDAAPLLFGWIVPAPGTWKDIRSLDVRLRDRNGVALWVRWDGPSDTLTLVDPVTGNATGPRRRPGTEFWLRGKLANLDVSDSESANSGPGGDTVALRLPVTFTPAAAAHNYLLEIGAIHTDGRLFFSSQGRVAVQAR